MTGNLYWDDAAVGAECTSPTVTVTEGMVNAYAELTGDFTPVHVDEEYAKTTPVGTRVAHGLFGLSLADGLNEVAPISWTVCRLGIYVSASAPCMAAS